MNGDEGLWSLIAFALSMFAPRAIVFALFISLPMLLLMSLWISKRWLTLFSILWLPASYFLAAGLLFVHYFKDGLGPDMVASEGFTSYKRVLIGTSVFLVFCALFYGAAVLTVVIGKWRTRKRMERKHQRDQAGAVWKSIGKQRHVQS